MSIQYITEEEVRSSITTQLRANPALPVVHDRGRGAVDEFQIAALCKTTFAGPPEREIVQGVVVRIVGFTEKPDDNNLILVQRTLRYQIIFCLTFDDDLFNTVTSSDYFSKNMVDDSAAYLRSYRHLGFNPSLVEHDYLSFQQDYRVRESERLGKFHLGIGTLNVRLKVPANFCP